MNMREEFEARFPTPAGVEWDDANQCYKCKVPSAYLALWMGWTAALAVAEASRITDALMGARCPGHGRSECVSCCWPKGEGYTAVDMGTAATDGYRDGAGRVAELEAFLTKLKHEDVEFYGSAIELGNSGPDGVELHEELLRLMP